MFQPPPPLLVLMLLLMLMLMPPPPVPPPPLAAQAHVATVISSHALHGSLQRERESYIAFFLKKSDKLIFLKLMLVLNFGLFV